MGEQKIGINGFGRIGRYFTRLAVLDPHADIGLINDLSDIETLMHLFKYDSVHGLFDLGFEISGDTVLFENGKKIRFSQESNPEKILWHDANVHTVVECTGRFLTKELAVKHLNGGAKKVLLSAPPKDESIKSIVMGVNEAILSDTDVIVSNASCTTNNVAPILKVVQSLSEIELCYISTIHSYTSDQRLHDAPHKDLRRARAAAHSIIPTTTGAAKAISKVFPMLKGRVFGGAIRVPVSNGSMTEITLNLAKSVSIDSITVALQKASESEMSGILDLVREPIVSVDIIGSSFSSSYDVLLSKAYGQTVRIVAWYDNEAGYSNRLLELVKKMF